jgi:hypothetical protein
MNYARWCPRGTGTHALSRTFVSPSSPGRSKPSISSAHFAILDRSLLHVHVIETQKWACLLLSNFLVRVVLVCPNGVRQRSRRVLMQGSVPKSQRKATRDARNSDVISREEFLEVEVRLSHFVQQNSGAKNARPTHRL